MRSNIKGIIGEIRVMPCDDFVYAKNSNKYEKTDTDTKYDRNRRNKGLKWFDMNKKNRHQSQHAKNGKKIYTENDKGRSIHIKNLRVDYTVFLAFRKRNIFFQMLGQGLESKVFCSYATVLAHRSKFCGIEMCKDVYEGFCAILWEEYACFFVENSFFITSFIGCYHGHATCHRFYGDHAEVLLMTHANSSRSSSDDMRQIAIILQG